MSNLILALWAQGGRYADRTIRGLCCLTIFCFFCTAIHADEEIKRRILIIPFDNMQSNKNYDWMSESISDNLKTELLKTNNFVVMDVSLLRKISPDIRFENLTSVEATALALKLNCEAAIIGRFFIKKKDGRDTALLQAEGVDAVTQKTVVIKSEYAELGATIFDTVQSMASNVAAELNAKLDPISRNDVKRNAKLERLIYLVENPPQGFFESLVLTGGTLDPEFDIDTFDYVMYLPQKKDSEKTEFSYGFVSWGKTFKPAVEAKGLRCNGGKCVLEQPGAELIFSKPKDARGIKYRITFKQAAPPEMPVTPKSGRPPLIGRWWFTGGIPFTKSLGIFGNANPATLVADGKPPLDAMKGFINVEAGLAPGRFQLPAGVQWSVASQLFYGTGDFPLNGGSTLGVSLMSMGGGLRLDRPFFIGKWFAISPVVGFYVHYQRYFSNWTTGLATMAVVPEIGFNHYIRLGKWRLMLSTLGGGFYYNNQNLSYLKINLGIEYAYR